MCADKQCVFSSPASELQRAVSLLGTEQDSSQLQQTLWVMGARPGSAWPVHYSESLSTNAGGEKVKPSCQALWWIHYDAFFFFQLSFFFFLSGLYFATFTKSKTICIWSPGNRNSSMATSSQRRPTDWWRRSAHFPLAPIRCWTKNKFFPKQSFKAALSKRKNVPKGAIKDYVSYRIVLFLGFSLNIFFLCFLLAAKEDTERASAERLLRRSEQLPEDPAAGGRRRERVCGQSQSQLQGVGE